MDVGVHQGDFNSGLTNPDGSVMMHPPSGFHQMSPEHLHYPQAMFQSGDEYAGYESLMLGDEEKVQAQQEAAAYLAALAHHHQAQAHYAYLQGMMQHEGEHQKMDGRMNPEAAMAAQLQMEAAMHILSLTGGGGQHIDAALAHQLQSTYGAMLGQEATMEGYSQLTQQQLMEMHGLSYNHPHNLSNNPYAQSGTGQSSYYHPGGGSLGQGSSQMSGYGYYPSETSTYTSSGFQSGQGRGSGRGRGRGGGGRGRTARYQPPPARVSGYKAPAVPAVELEGLNPSPEIFDADLPRECRFFVIKSYSEDDVHKSIKYGLWTSTETGNRRLNEAFHSAAQPKNETSVKQETLTEVTPDSEDPSLGPLPKRAPRKSAAVEGAVADETASADEPAAGKEEPVITEVKEKTEKSKPAVYLFFSVNASGQFCGMAQMESEVNFDAQFSAWAQSKWKGQFKVRWLFVKDIPNNALRHIILANNDNKPVTNSRDTQEIPYQQGCELVRIFAEYEPRTSLLDDFEYYDKRQMAMELGQQSDLPPPVISSDYSFIDRNKAKVGTAAARRKRVNPRDPVPVASTDQEKETGETEPSKQDEVGETVSDAKEEPAEQEEPGSQQA